MRATSARILRGTLTARSLDNSHDGKNTRVHPLRPRTSLAVFALLTVILSHRQSCAATLVTQLVLAASPQATNG